MRDTFSIDTTELEILTETLMNSGVLSFIVSCNLLTKNKQNEYYLVNLCKKLMSNNFIVLRPQFKHIEMHIPYIERRQTDRQRNKMDEDGNKSVLKRTTTET